MIDALRMPLRTRPLHQQHPDRAVVDRGDLPPHRLLLAYRKYMPPLVGHPDEIDALGDYLASLTSIPGKSLASRSSSSGGSGLPASQQ